LARIKRPTMAPAAGGHHERMSAVDTAWLRMDGPGNAMVIVSVMTTATPVPLTELRRVIETRWLCFPRFRLRPVPDALGASWQADPEFDLDRHLVSMELPAPGGQRELEALVGTLASARLDPARPLWQVHFIPRYGPGSAWILRLHHCYADGMALLRVLLSLSEQDTGPALAAQAGPGPRQGTSRRGTPLLSLFDRLEHLTQPTGDLLEHALAGGTRLLESGIHQLFHPDSAAQFARHAGGVAGELGRLLALPDDPPSPLRRPLSGRKRVAWSPPLPLAEVQTVARALGCTVNDVLLATVAGALGAHLRDGRTPSEPDLVLRASVPVNLREAESEGSLGNRFGLVFVDLPVGIVNPLQRVYAVHATMRAIKDSPQPAATLLVLGLLGRMPAGVQAPAVEMFSRKSSLVASNVPGPRAPLHLCGQRIDSMHFWVPQSGSIGVGVSLLSYAGQVHAGLIADRRCVPDPGRLIRRLGPEFERLLLATTVGLLGVRPATRRRRKGAAHDRVPPAD
jgi:WS/DGAT/MGAT family acyltransferase